MIETASPPKLDVVEVFADISCPFTHVGLRRLVAERDQLGRDDVVVRVRAWPLELINGAPLSGDFVGEEIDALRTAVAPDLFEGFDRCHFPGTTLPALALADAAYRRSNDTGERVSLALRTALFEEGHDISEPSELAAIARTHGLELPGPDDVRSVHDDWHEGQRRGVIGSPHFFVGHQSYFCPTLTIERIEGHLEVTFDRGGFAAFTATVFARSDANAAP